MSFKYFIKYTPTNSFNHIGVNKEIFISEENIKSWFIHMLCYPINKFHYAFNESAKNSFSVMNTKFEMVIIHENLLKSKTCEIKEFETHAVVYHDWLTNVINYTIAGNDTLYKLKKCDGELFICRNFFEEIFLGNYISDELNKKYGYDGSVECDQIRKYRMYLLNENGSNIPSPEYKEYFAYKSSGYSDEYYYIPIVRGDNKFELCQKTIKNLISRICYSELNITELLIKHQI